MYYGPLHYNISTTIEGDPGVELALIALRQDIQANSLVMYFDIGNAAITLSPEQKEIVAKMSRYIDKANDNAVIEIIGHTDDIGDWDSNVKLALSRANFAKEYFVENNILETKIKTTSKGPDQPIADNATEEGRSKNRRVVVTIN
ncbi:OmpA family protein [Lacinutrix neustonica]|uniref:OmpA family protein n=1 Tax=Lacinutrix neustonica TaxID=2980107 RepID=A0A9E8SC43_9FLAO|nr:OmpA family protein [Lacinutrix neustonica]WAC00903.1 OmpA family protein [Lacinutrix neustonica]